MHAPVLAAYVNELPTRAIRSPRHGFRQSAGSGSRRSASDVGCADDRRKAHRRGLRRTPCARLHRAPRGRRTRGRERRMRRAPGSPRSRGRRRLARSSRRTCSSSCRRPRGRRRRGRAARTRAACDEAVRLGLLQHRLAVGGATSGWISTPSVPGRMNVASGSSQTCCMWTIGSCCARNPSSTWRAFSAAASGLDQWEPAAREVVALDVDDEQCSSHGQLRFETSPLDAFTSTLGVCDDTFAAGRCERARAVGR